MGAGFRGGSARIRHGFDDGEQQWLERGSKREGKNVVLWRFYVEISPVSSLTAEETSLMTWPLWRRCTDALARGLIIEPPAGQDRSFTVQKKHCAKEANV